MTAGRTEDTATIIAALAYVTALYRELSDENGAPPLGTQNQVVDFVLSDAMLTDYVQRWASRQHEDDPVPAPPQRLPRDGVYDLIAARMRDAMEAPIFLRQEHNPP